MNRGGQTEVKKRFGWVKDQPEMIIMSCGGWREGWKKVIVFWWKIIICAINKDLREGDFGFNVFSENKMFWII